MSRTAIYPGSFDPVTNGHLDILKRALGIFDKVIIAVAENEAKQALFSAKRRCELLRAVVKSEPRIEVDHFKGLLVEYAHKRGVRHVVRGIRAVADFEYEFQLALMNRQLQPEFDSVFLMTDERHLFVSSALVKEVARLGGDVTAFVPKPVHDALVERLARNKS